MQFLKQEPTNFRRLFDALLELYGPQGWWPLLELRQCVDSGEYNGDSIDTRKDLHARGYHPEKFHFPQTNKQVFEIGCGAVLTQNTNWKQAEKALWNMRETGFLDCENLARFSPGSVESELSEQWQCLLQAVRCAGYFRSKSATLVRWAVFFSALQERTPERSELLTIKGIGAETADCILCYGYHQPVFVADLYSRRLLVALGWLPPNVTYEQTREWVEKHSPADSEFLQELHALIVIEGKQKSLQSSIGGML